MSNQSTVSRSSRKRTPSGSRKSVRNWSWSLTGMILVSDKSSISDWWPLTRACTTRTKQYHGNAKIPLYAMNVCFIALCNMPIVAKKTVVLKIQ